MLKSTKKDHSVLHNISPLLLYVGDFCNNRKAQTHGSVCHGHEFSSFFIETC